MWRSTALRLPIVLTLLAVLLLPLSGCANASDCGFQPNTSSHTPTVSESLGVNIHFTEPLVGELKMLADTGVRWVRMDFKWDETEKTKGVYDFSAYDRLLSSLQSYKIRALFILDYGNNLYENGSPPRSDEARQAFANWAVAAAKHFAGRGVMWETYNEPNNSTFWQPKASANEYAALALVVGRAFRAAVPQEKLIGPAVGEMDFSFLEETLKSGVLEHWSGVSVHPYLRNNPENVVSNYCRLRTMINANAKSPAKEIPIIASEWGYSSAWRNMTEERQGQLLARQWLTNIGNGIALSIWYDWRDDGTDASDPEHHFGMVAHRYYEGREPVFDPKPAYLAARTLVKFFSNYRFEKRIAVGSEHDYVLVFRDKDNIRLAAWTTRAPHDVTVPIRGDYSQTRHTGERTSTVTDIGNGLKVNLTTSPVYLCRVGDC